MKCEHYVLRREKKLKWNCRTIYGIITKKNMWNESNFYFVVKNKKETERLQDKTFKHMLLFCNWVQIKEYSLTQNWTDYRNRISGMNLDDIYFYIRMSCRNTKNPLKCLSMDLERDIHTLHTYVRVSLTYTVYLCNGNGSSYLNILPFYLIFVEWIVVYYFYF